MKTKTTLIIISTLIVGFVLGFISHGYFIKNRFDRLREFRKPGIIKNIISDRLDLTDEQKEKIDPILSKYENMFREFGMKARTEMAENLKKLKEEISPYLTEEQMEDMEENFLKRKGKFPPRPPFRD